MDSLKTVLIVDDAFINRALLKSLSPAHITLLKPRTANRRWTFCEKTPRAYPVSCWTLICL